MNFNKTRRRAGILATLGLMAGLGACSDLLTVQNPGKLNDPDLNDPVLVQNLVNSGVAGFQGAFDDLVWAGADLGDEAVNGHNFEQWKRIDLRLIEADNSIMNTDIYQPLQAARFAADSIAGRVKLVYGDTINNTGRLGVARLKVFGGYSYVMLGEYFCQAPINGSAGLPSDSLLARAIADFGEAITYAKAVKGASAVGTSTADSLITMAYIGTARAYLGMGNKAKAIEFATPVANGLTYAGSFRYDVTYSDNTALPNDILWTATTGSSRYLGVDASFRNLTIASAGGPVKDVRVRHTATAIKGHNGLTDLFTPYQGESHGAFNPATTSVYAPSTSIRLASTLEASYILAEAQGPTAATLTFVNQRRAYGASGAAGTDVALTGDPLMAELRDQRRRDFFLDGHRLGDLRRYKAQYGVDQFPSGQHPNVEWGSYGTATCFTPTINESIGNPNYHP
jgi:hypothetical protein